MVPPNSLVLRDGVFGRQFDQQINLLLSPQLSVLLAGGFWLDEVVTTSPSLVLPSPSASWLLWFE